MVKETLYYKTPIFIRFLKEVKAYKRFFRNLETLPRYGDDVTMDRLIMCAFTWANTPEGEYFWSRLDTCWCEIAESGRKLDFRDPILQNIIKDYIQ